MLIGILDRIFHKLRKSFTLLDINKTILNPLVEIGNYMT
jgi:hypothetical protein